MKFGHKLTTIAPLEVKVFMNFQLLDTQKWASDKLSDVSFMKTFALSGAIVVNLFSNLIKKFSVIVETSVFTKIIDL